MPIEILMSPGTGGGTVAAWGDISGKPANVVALAGLTSAANKLGFFNGVGTMAVQDFPADSQALLASANYAAMRTAMGVQDTLVSGTNIKTINGSSILGAGNLVVSGGGGLSDGDYGSVTVSGGGTVITIDAGVVTSTMMGGDVTSAGKALLTAANVAAQQTALSLVPGTNVQAYDAELAAIAGLTSAANKLPYFSGSGTAALTDFSAFGRTLVDDADNTAARVTLGLVIGTDVQAYSAKLAAVAGLTWAANKAVVLTGTSTLSTVDFSTFVQGILGSADQSAFRTAIGISAISVSASTLYGRGSAGGSGALESITLGSGLGMSGTTISVDSATRTKGWEFQAFFDASFVAQDITSTGNGLGGIFVAPPSMNGKNVVSFTVQVINAGTTGTCDFQLRRVRAGTPADVCSTPPKIDSTETSSLTGTVAVIDGANDDIATGDIFYLDIDALSTTKPKGLIGMVEVQ